MTKTKYRTEIKATFIENMFHITMFVMWGGFTFLGLKQVANLEEYLTPIATLIWLLLSFKTLQVIVPTNITIVKKEVKEWTKKNF